MQNKSQTTEGNTAKRRYWRRNRRAVAILSIVLISMLSLMIRQFFTDHPGQLHNKMHSPGFLDLSDWRPDQGPMPLQAMWHFSWHDSEGNDTNSKQFSGYVNAHPHLWNAQPDTAPGRPFPSQGTGTYRLKVKLPPHTEPLALHIERQMLTFRLFVNGQLLAVSGANRVTPRIEPRMSDAIAILPTGLKEADILLQITNLHHYSGGFRQPVILDTAKHITGKYDSRHVTALLTAAICFSVGIVSIIMSGSGRNRREYLWLTLFSMLVSFRIALNNNMFADLFPDLSVSLALRLNMIAQFSLAIVYLSYHHALLPAHSLVTRLPGWLQPLHLLRGIFGLAIIAALILPIIDLSHLREPFLIIAFLGFVWLLIMMVKAAKNGIRAGTLLLLMTLVLLTGFVHDALMTAGIFYGREWFPLAFLGFVLGQAFILSGRTNFAFRRAAELKDDLYSLNQDLENRIKTRTSELEKAKIAADAGNAAKSRFLATISHEIRTPMNGITGVLDMLQRSGLSQNQQQLVSMASESTQSLITLINDILDFSKIEAGKLDLEIMETPLVPLLESVTTLMAPSAEADGLVLVNDIQPDLATIQLTTDPTRLRQILLNLIGNAIKFTSQGQVVLRATQDPNTTQNRLLIEVLDSGIGLDDHARPRLFEPFEQADDTTTRRFGGTGLGLSICKTLAELLGGEIGGENRPGGGSRFWISLPARFSSMESDDSPIPLNGKSVSLAIPDSVICDALRPQLEALGANTHIEEKNNDRLIQADVSIIWCPVMAGDPILPNPIFLAARNTILLIDSRFTGHPALKSIKAQILSTPWTLAGVRQACIWAIGAEERQQTFDWSPPHDNPKGIDSPDPDASLFNKGTILVADDNEMNRRLLQMQLHERDFTCILVEDGKAALDYLDTHIPDLLITDYHMPGLNGIALAQAIRQRENEYALRRLPIIGLTAAATQEDIDRLMDSGMDAVLTKPLDYDRLVNLLHQFLSSVATCQSVDNAPESSKSCEILDHTILDAFFGDDVTAKKDMLRDFISNNQHALKRLKIAWQNKDRSEMFHASHVIYGSSSSIGMKAVAGIAGQMEGLADAEQHQDYDWQQANTQLHAIEQLLADTSDIVEKL